MDSSMPVVTCQSVPFPRQPAPKFTGPIQSDGDGVPALSPDFGTAKVPWLANMCRWRGRTPPNPGCREYPQQNALARYLRAQSDRQIGIDGSTQHIGHRLATLFLSRPDIVLHTTWSHPPNTGPDRGPSRWLSLGMSVPCGCAAPIVQTEN